MTTIKGSDNLNGILFVMNHYPDSRNGGIENVTRLLSAKFKEMGYAVHVRYLYKTEFDHSDDSIFDSCGYVEWNDLESEVNHIVQAYRVGVVVNRCVIIASPVLRKAISGTKCKLITTYNNKPTITSRSIKEILGDSTIGMFKKIAIMLSYPIYKYRSIKRLQQTHRNSYQASDKIILLSNQYIKEYTSLYGVESDKIYVINNPIKSGVKITKSEFELKEKIVLMVTRLDEEQKCVIKALKLWRIVAPIMKDWRMIIIGNGPDEAKIKAFRHAKAIPNVEFIPACNPIEYYKQSSIFLMTSRNEGWPNTLNEAMRYGCVPVVLATFSAVYDMIDNGINGYIVEPEAEDKDMAHLQDIILGLHSDTTLIKKLALSSIEKTHRLSIENIVPRWMQLFNS